MYRQAARAFALAFALSAYILTASGPARAQPAFDPSEIKQIPLTTASVRGFIACFPRIEEFDKQYHRETNREWTGTMEGLADYVQMKPALAKLEGIVQACGFKTYVGFLEVARSVILTYAHVKLDRSSADLKNQMEMALKAIENNPDLSAEQKRQLSEMAQGSLAALGSLRPLPENIPVVESLMAELDPLMESQ
jgi:phage shock protein PspC (stress-responsive transcriptional regulator)